MFYQVFKFQPSDLGCSARNFLNSLNYKIRSRRQNCKGNRALRQFRRVLLFARYAAPRSVDCFTGGQAKVAPATRSVTSAAAVLSM